MAKRYVFRLEAVLKLRKRREDDWRMRVARQVRELLSAREELQRLETEICGELDLIRTGQRQPSFDVVLARRQRGYMAWLERRALESRQRAVALEGELRQCQAALTQASREVKVLEKLRERQMSRADELTRRAERTEEDESGARMFIMNRSTALAE